MSSLETSYDNGIAIVLGGIAIVGAAVAVFDFWLRRFRHRAIAWTLIVALGAAFGLSRGSVATDAALATGVVLVPAGFGYITALALLQILYRPTGGQGDAVAQTPINPSSSAKG